MVDLCAPRLQLQLRPRGHSSADSSICSLELGAGGGLVGLAVAKGCDIQNRLLLTDQLEMLDLMQHNIQLNDVGSSVGALILNWWVP